MGVPPIKGIDFRNRSKKGRVVEELMGVPPIKGIDFRNWSKKAGLLKSD